MKGISRDERLQAICALMGLGFVGHFIQLFGEDVPCRPWARLRYWNTPGWHLYLPEWVPWTILGALAVTIVMTAFRRTRPWVLATIALYAAHYLSYPFRIRNHMTTVLASLTMIGGCWLIGRASRAVDLRGRGPRARRVDRWAVTGVAVAITITYFYAGLHKANENFLAFDATRSAAVEGLTTFWIYGDLGNVPPIWAMALACYGTVVIEIVAPILAWRVHRLRVPMVILLFLFHFPHVAVMNVADYPMIASAFYPALFSRAHFRLVLRHAHANAWTLSGAAVGVAAQLWWIPWWGGLTVFGIVVMALWGWAAAAMLRMLYRARSVEQARRSSMSAAA